MTCLVDASVLMAAYLKDEIRHEMACHFLQRCPEIWLCNITMVEVINALAGVVRRQRLSAADALLVEQEIRAMGFPVFSVDDYLSAALAASLDGKGHPYDLIQAVTAQAHGTTWVTLDERQRWRLRGTPLAEAVQSLEQVVDELP